MADAVKREVFSGTVRATLKGYAGETIREPGDVFVFEGVLGSWMEPVGGSGRAEVKSAVKPADAVAAKAELAAAKA